MIDVSRFTDALVASFTEGGATQYKRDEVLTAAAEYNSAEAAYDEIMDRVSDIVKSYRAPLVGLINDTPESIQRLWKWINRDAWYAPLENGSLPHTGREYLPAGKWLKSAAKFRAEIKRIEKLIKEVAEQ